MVRSTMQWSGRCMIAVALGARTTSEAESALHEVAASADIAELRLDLMEEYDLPRLLRRRPCPVIVTNRPEREGGRFRGAEEERVRTLREAIDLGAEFVDVEHDAVHLLPDRGDTKLVISHHDLEKMPAHLANVHRRLAELGADVVKVVGLATSATDNLQVLDTFASATLPTIAIAMGEMGVMSRILAMRYPSAFLTFATLGRGQQVAPGQLSMATMLDLYRARELTEESEIYGVLGDAPIAEADLATYNRGLRASAANAVCVPFQTPRAPADVIAAFRKVNVKGYSVMPPFQDQIESALDGVDRRARERGQINTVIYRSGKLWGFWLDDQSEQVRLWTDSLRRDSLAAVER